MRTRLGEHLVNTGLISAQQLAEALADQRVTHTPLGEVLQRRGWITSEVLAITLADQLDLPYVDVTRVRPSADAMAAVPRAIAMTLGVLPLGWIGSTLRVAMADPLDIGVLEELAALLRTELAPEVADASYLLGAIDNHYAAVTELKLSLAERRAKLHRRADDLLTRGHEPRLVVCAGAAPGIGLSHLVNSVAARAAAAGRQVAVIDASLHPNPALLPPGWGPDSLNADLMHGVMHPMEGAAAPEGSITFLGGATGAPLRRAKAGEFLTLAENFLVIGGSHGLLLCDIGGPPLNAAAHALLAADMPILVLSPQDTVAALDLLRETAGVREASLKDPTLAAPWEASVVVSLADSAAGGRAVFDALNDAVTFHHNPDVSTGGGIRLRLAGTILFDRNTVAMAEESRTPVALAAPDCVLAQDLTGVTDSVLRQVDLIDAATPPLALLIGLGAVRQAGSPES